MRGDTVRLLLFAAALALLAAWALQKPKVTTLRVTPQADSPSYKVRLTEVLPGPGER
jgi:lipopolysaccharide export system protein LptC